MGNTRRWTAIATGILVTSIVICAVLWVWLGLRIDVLPQRVHVDAVGRWEAAQIDRYRMVVRVQETFRPSGVYELMVVDDSIESAQLFSTGAYRYDPNPIPFDVDATQAASYTVESLFTRSQRLADDLPVINIHTLATSHISYDPEIGYPQHYVENTCGLLVNDAIQACVTEVIVLEFEVLADQAE